MKSSFEKIEAMEIEDVEQRINACFDFKDLYTCFENIFIYMCMHIHTHTYIYNKIILSGDV